MHGAKCKHRICIMFASSFLIRSERCHTMCRSDEVGRIVDNKFPLKVFKRNLIKPWFQFFITVRFLGGFCQSSKILFIHRNDLSWICYRQKDEQTIEMNQTRIWVAIVEDFKVNGTLFSRENVKQTTRGNFSKSSKWENQFRLKTI